jgi:hypothetical protein
MSNDKSASNKPAKGNGGALLAGAAIGSAAIAAAVLYASRRKHKNPPQQVPPIPSGEPPETD